MVSLSATAPKSNCLVISLWVMLGFVLLLMLLPALIGSFLGDEFEGSASVRIDRGAEEVWAAVEDFESHPVHGKAVLSVDDLGEVDGQPAWEERMQRSAALVTTVAVDPPRRIERHVESPDDAFDTVWTLEITGDAEACEVTLTQQITVTGTGWFGANLRFFVLFRDEGERRARVYLEGLEADLEAGGPAR